MKFGKNFAFYRKKLGITQEEVAERLFVSRQTVSRWENGAVVPDVQMLISICELFECDLDSLLRKDVSSEDDFSAHNQADKLSDYNEAYDRHMNRYAFFVALGVALILIGVTTLVFLNAFSKLELISVVLLFVFIFSAVAIFVFFGVEHYAFMRENPFILPYPKDILKAFSKKFSWHIIIATGLIAIGLVFVIITNYDYNSIPADIDKTVWEHVTVGTFLSLVTVAVFIYVYSGMLYAKYNVDEYNEECAKEGFSNSDLFPDIKKEKSIVGGVCAAIMLAATAAFLFVGFLFNKWHIAVVIFPIGALCCGIFSILFNAFKK